jgi:hypothetical protein
MSILSHNNLLGDAGEFFRSGLATGGGAASTSSEEFPSKFDQSLIKNLNTASGDLEKHQESVQLPVTSRNMPLNTESKEK